MFFWYVIDKIIAGIFMDDYRRKLLRYYSGLFFLFSIIVVLLGFIGISSANNNSTLIMTNIAYGLSLVMIGCILLLGSILFLIKANELD